MFNFSISRIPHSGKASNFFLSHAFSYSLFYFLISASFKGWQKLAAGRDADHIHNFDFVRGKGWSPPWRWKASTSRTGKMGLLSCHMRHTLFASLTLFYPYKHNLSLATDKLILTYRKICLSLSHEDYLSRYVAMFSQKYQRESPPNNSHVVDRK
jgi:hypothetical protein